MAELHVQRKENSVWPWIVVALIVLALLFWYFWGRGDNLNVAAVDDTDSTMVGAVSDEAMVSGTTQPGEGSAVAQYLQFVDARASRAAGLAHDYTADGLRQLAAALSEVSAANPVAGVAEEQRIAEIRERADAMQRDPTSTQHALQTREAFIMISSTIAQMSGSAADRAADNLDALKNAATGIDASRLLSDQADKIEEFFAQAAESIRDMT